MYEEANLLPRREASSGEMGTWFVDGHQFKFFGA